MSARFHLRLWNSPYNGGWIWFDREARHRFSAGWRAHTLWWALLGFCGYIVLQDWPWQRRPKPLA